MTENKADKQDQEEDSAIRHRNTLSRAKQTLAAASRLLRKKIPCSGHLMTPRRLWIQTVPTQDCDVVLTFPSGTQDFTLMWLLSRLRAGTPGLVVYVRHHASSDCYGFYLTAPYNVLLKTAEELHLPKQVRPEFGGGLKEFVMQEAGCFEGMEDEQSFFTTQERQWLVLHLLQTLRAADGDEIGGLRLIEGQAIIPKCLAAGVISQVFPLHELPALGRLQKTWVQAFFQQQPLDSICEYFGVKIAMYFAWLGHYTTALIVPAVVGFIFWIGFCGHDQQTEDIGFVLFSFFNVLWASIYLEAWKRYSAELAYKWGTLDQGDELLVEPRPLFTGPLEVSPVTGRLEPTYPSWKRNLFRYFVSVPVICLCLLVVFVVMFLILELQGWWDKLIKDRGYPFCLSYIPKIFLALVIMLMDDAYHKVALWLNDKENFRVEENYQNHLIIKLILFQFVNSFLSLFYIAFYLQDQEQLKEQLAALLIARQVIGNIKESAFPYLLEQVRLAKLSFDLFGALSPSEEKEDGAVEEPGTDTPENLEDESPKKKQISRNISQAELESSLFKYDGTFEDHLEMFIQFGYVVLFSSAFPMAGLCALLNNIIEIRSDAFKLCFIFQRPFGQRVPNIGTWQDAMEIMGIIAVLVNCALIGLSGQVNRMFPEMSTTQTILLIVILEHVLLILRFIIIYAIPDIPDWVATEMAKVEFSRREAFRRYSSTTSPAAQDAASAVSGLVIGRFVVSPANSSDGTETTDYESNFDKNSTILGSCRSTPTTENAFTPTEDEKLLPETVQEEDEEEEEEEHRQSNKSLNDASKATNGGSEGDIKRKDSKRLPSAAPPSMQHFTIGPHGGINWARKLAQEGSGRKSVGESDFKVGSLPSRQVERDSEVAIRHSTDCIVKPKDLSASSESDLLRSAPPWVDAQKLKFRFSPEKDQASPTSSRQDVSKPLSPPVEKSSQKSRPSFDKSSTQQDTPPSKPAATTPASSSNSSSPPSTGAKPKTSTPSPPTSGGEQGATGPKEAASTEDLAAKKLKVKRSLLKRARSVAIFSLKLKERRAREAAKEEMKEAKAKEDSFLRESQVHGELSMIPIEKLISVDDVAVQLQKRQQMK